MAILVRGYFIKIPPIAARSYMRSFSQWGDSSKVLPLQPVAGHSYMANLVGG